MQKRTGWFAAIVLGTPLMGAAQYSGAAAKGPLLAGIEHVSLSVAKGDADAEFKFLAKLGFEEALSPFHNASGQVSGGWGKINDSQFVLFEEPYTPSAKQLAQAGAGRTGHVLPPVGYFHFCYLTPNVSEVYARWEAAGLKPTQIHIGEGFTIETEIDNPEIILHNPGGDHGEAIEYLKDQHKDTQNSAQTREKGQHLGSNRISEQLIGFDMPVNDIPLWQSFYVKQGLVASKEGDKVKLSFPEVSNQYILLRAAGPNETYINATRLLFGVKDVTKAAEQLNAAGLEVKVQNNEATVRDVAGNAFVFVQR